MNDNDISTAIAIVGMDGRFPGATSVPALWQNLLDGVEAVRPYSEEEVAAAGVPRSLAERPEYVAAGAELDDADAFDAEFFAIPAHEARLMDPQHRVFLECAWAALEDAGRIPNEPAGRVGVFGSSSISSYLINVLARSEALTGDGVNYPVLLGNDKDFLATRVSYKLGLTGPSVTVQTACSSSLTAVHLACQALLAGDCDIALAGGVSITFPQTAGYLYREGGILSPDGRCRVFDTDAAGTVKGNGCAVVVLRRHEDAVRDGDHIHAVIRGTAINNDGGDKVGFTAPGPAGQVEVIRDALDLAGVPASDIGYVEAHGTGTALGDPIEVHALAQAHRDTGAPPEHCLLGSVKANIGHLDAAAGATGLIKAALVLRDQAVPGQPTFSAGNPRLRLEQLPYEVPTQTVRPAQPLRAAGVSSFGLGGTNAHAVLAPPPADTRDPVPGDRYAILLSADDEEALTETARRLLGRLTGERCPRLDDVALTLARGRRALAVRTVFAVASIDELIEALERGDRHDHEPALREWLSGGESCPDVGDLSLARRVDLPARRFRRTRHWVDVQQPEQVAVPAAGAAAAVAVAVAVETVQAVIARHLGDELAEDDDIWDVGVDSLMAVEIVTSLRDAFGVTLAVSELNATYSPRAIAALLERRLSEQHASERVVELVRAGTGGSGVFLVHPAGGTTICYADLARHLDSDRALYGIGFPAREAESLTSIRDLARRYVDELREVQPAGPYTLGGYSFGGNVAFEMALLLEAAGETVERIVMLDSHPPEAYVGGVAEDSDFVQVFPVLLSAILPGVELPPGCRPQDIGEALEAVRRPSWSDSMVAELRRFFEIWRHNHAALKRWYPDDRVRADVLLFEASERETDEIVERLGIRRVDKQAWTNHLSGGLSVVAVPGDHYSMMRDPSHLAVLAGCLDEALARD